MAALTFENVDFSYSGRAVLAGVSFTLSAERVLAVLGPSGVGKSTVLRLTAGLEAPDSGEIRLNGRLASASRRVVLDPSERSLSVVFQDLALWPHLTCDQHVAFVGPALRPAEREQHLSDVGLRSFGARFPAEMSGGERQRLALARALGSKPKLLLLDEPFTALDPELRAELIDLLLALHRRHGVAILYVTHDLKDAFSLGDDVLFLNAGRVEQVGPPVELYQRPVSRSVATFVGKGTIVPGRVRGEELVTALGRFPNPRRELSEGAVVDVVIRPEDVETGEGEFQALVESVVFEEGRYLVKARLEAHSIWLHSTIRVAPGSSIPIRAGSGWPLPS